MRVEFKLIEGDSISEFDVIREINHEIQRRGITSKESIEQSFSSVGLTVAEHLDLYFYGIKGISYGFKSKAI